MRFHVVSLPHTQTTKNYNWCAYTEKVRKFCMMMKSLGHEVFLYAGEDNEAPCDKLITCITKAEQKELFSKNTGDFTIGAPQWQIMNGRAIAAIKESAKPRDFICLIAGLCQKQIADAFPTMISVEFGVGYGGVFSPYKVFESYAWMHTVYGSQNRDAHAIDGSFYDCVIPNYFDPQDFPFSREKGDYYLYLGRLTDRKGVTIASEVCEKMGVPLIIAGEGEPPKYGTYVGVVDTVKRGVLMSQAKALFAPTLYIEPFGGVAVEAMLCGTPVITTDWGAFTETVIHSKTGFRCRTFAEFYQAARDVEALDNNYIRSYALKNFTLKEVRWQYQMYFDQLRGLWGEGWYSPAQEELGRNRYGLFV